MAWVKLDDNFPDHPKVEHVGPLGGWLHVCALAYCNRMLTDGYVPEGRVPKLARFDDIFFGPGGNELAGPLYEIDPMDLADQLVAVGMWKRTEGGFLIEHYLEYQPSREEVEARRLVRAAAGSRGGKQKASKASSKPLAKSEANDVAEAKPNPAPYPGPVPDTSSSSGSEEPPTAANSEEERLTQTWQILGERDCKRARERGQSVGSPKAYAAQCGANRRADQAGKASLWITRFPDLSAAELADLLDGCPPPLRHRAVAKVEVLEPDPEFLERLNQAKAVLGPKQKQETA